jgi:hypothetical protein
MSAQLIAQRFSCPALRASDRSFREGRRRILEHEGEHCVRQRDAAKSPRVRAPKWIVEPLLSEIRFSTGGECVGPPCNPEFRREHADTAEGLRKAGLAKD